MAIESSQSHLASQRGECCRIRCGRGCPGPVSSRELGDLTPSVRLAQVWRRVSSTHAAHSASIARVSSALVTAVVLNEQRRRDRRNIGGLNVVRIKGDLAPRRGVGELDTNGARRVPHLLGPELLADGSTCDVQQTTHISLELGRSSPMTFGQLQSLGRRNPHVAWRQSQATQSRRLVWGIPPPSSAESS